MTQTMGEEIAELRNENLELNTELLWRRREIEEDNDQIATLKSEVERLDNERQQIQSWADRLLGDMADLRLEKERLTARITELTQADPSWFDASPADAFRMLKQAREEGDRLKRDAIHLTDAVCFFQTKYSACNYIALEQRAEKAEEERDRLKGWLERALEAADARYVSMAEARDRTAEIRREMEEHHG